MDNSFRVQLYANKVQGKKQSGEGTEAFDLEKYGLVPNKSYVKSHIDSLGMVYYDNWLGTGHSVYENFLFLADDL